MSLLVLADGKARTAVFESRDLSMKLNIISKSACYSFTLHEL